MTLCVPKMPRWQDSLILMRLLVGELSAPKVRRSFQAVNIIVPCSIGLALNGTFCVAPACRRGFRDLQVMNLLRRARLRASIRPVTITAGDGDSIDDRGVCSAPRKELVSTLQLLLQSRRLKVTPNLPASATLVRVLMRFRNKATLSANDALEVWRERPHDDLVLAVAVAAWLGETLKEFWIR